MPDRNSRDPSLWLDQQPIDAFDAELLDAIRSLTPGDEIGQAEPRVVVHAPQIHNHYAQGPDATPLQTAQPQQAEQIRRSYPRSSRLGKRACAAALTTGLLIYAGPKLIDYGFHEFGKFLSSVEHGVVHELDKVGGDVKDLAEHFVGKPGLHVSGQTYFDINSLKAPDEGIVDELGGRGHLELDFTGGLLNVNILGYNPTKKELQSYRKDQIVMMVNDIADNVQIIAPPKPGQPGSRSNQTIVKVNESALEIEEGGVKCTTIGKNEEECKDKFDNSILDSVKPRVPILDTLVANGDISNTVKEFTGINLANGISNVFFGQPVDVASNTSAADMDTDHYVEHACGKKVLSDRPLVIYGVKKLVSGWFQTKASSNTSYNGDHDLIQATNDPIQSIKVEIIETDGEQNTGSTIATKFADPRPTASYIAAQMNDKNIKIGTQDLYACKAQDPSDQNKLADEDAQHGDTLTGNQLLKIAQENN
jgi:hypothetical protein